MDDSQGASESWAAVVAAEQDLARKRAAFYRSGDIRVEILRKALAGSNWDKKAALSLLSALPADVPALINELVDMALSHDSSREAKTAIAAPGRRSEFIEILGQCIVDRLPEATPEDCLQFIDVLINARAWNALAAVLRHVEESDDPDLQAVADDYSSEWKFPTLP